MAATQHRSSSTYDSGILDAHLDLDDGGASETSSETEVRADELLAGKSVIVTAGATGVGAAVVRIVAEAGAYVTIADSAAVEGQRLMLELVERNLRVQYIYTTLASFSSQAEAFHHARLFSPHRTIDLVIACGALPPPVPPPSAATPTPHPKPPTPSLLAWLAATPPSATHPSTAFPSPPPTNPVDRGITAAIHSAHLAVHHFRFAPVFDRVVESGPVVQGRGRGGRGGAGAGIDSDYADKQLILLAPLASYAPPPLDVARETSLADVAAAAGVRGIFTGVRDALGGAGGGTVGGASGGIEKGIRARVNLVAVPEVLDEVAGGAGGYGGAGEGVSERDCAEVVLEVACAADVGGTALAVTGEGVRDVSGA